MHPDRTIGLVSPFSTSSTIVRIEFFILRFASAPIASSTKQNFLPSLPSIAFSFITANFSGESTAFCTKHSNASSSPWQASHTKTTSNPLPNRTVATRFRRFRQLRKFVLARLRPLSPSILVVCANAELEPAMQRKRRLEENVCALLEKRKPAIQSKRAGKRENLVREKIDDLDVELVRGRNSGETRRVVPGPERVRRIDRELLNGARGERDAVAVHQELHAEQLVFLLCQLEPSGKNRARTLSAVSPEAFF